jgi:hypothetical protein
MNASVIQKERVKLHNFKKKWRARAHASAQSSDIEYSDTVVSVGVIKSDRSDIDLPNGNKRSKAKTKKSSSELKSCLRKTGKRTRLKPWTKKKPTKKLSNGLKTTAIESEDST